MNEFPPKFLEVSRESTGSRSPMMNVSEYLDHLYALGIKEKGFARATAHPSKAHLGTLQRWPTARRSSREVIEQLKKEDHRFHMEGGSWTNDISGCAVTKMSPA